VNDYRRAVLFIRDCTVWRCCLHEQRATRPRSGTARVMEQRILFTTSWDDGHPLDMRLADMLARHGFRGTFYMPLSNREGLPVLAPGDMRRLAEGFEIGSHTLEHCYLQSVAELEARRQIVSGKDQVECILGRRVSGFCYPGGHYTSKHRQMVAEAGFEYARTVASFHRELLADPFAMPTTIQFYPHASSSLLRNFIRQGEWRRRTRLFALAWGYRDLVMRLQGLLDYVCLHGGAFHLWGHSWEVERFEGWRQLESFLVYAKERIPAEDRLTNHEMLQHPASHVPDPA
jgi:peptidoglycan/xylan/chitin deacetylase (PgdA/CDA1 family)